MKITQRQLSGYYQAHKEWISDNDNYNLQKFGISKKLYGIIHHAIIELNGICGNTASLAQINKRLINIESVK
jgi:hypothetical protein